VTRLRLSRLNKNSWRDREKGSWGGEKGGLKGWSKAGCFEGGANYDRGHLGLILRGL